MYLYHKQTFGLQEVGFMIRYLSCVTSSKQCSVCLLAPACVLCTVCVLFYPDWGLGSEEWDAREGVGTIITQTARSRPNTHQKHLNSEQVQYALVLKLLPSILLTSFNNEWKLIDLVDLFYCIVDTFKPDKEVKIWHWVINKCIRITRMSNPQNRANCVNPFFWFDFDSTKKEIWIVTKGKKSLSWGSFFFNGVHFLGGSHF